MTHVGVRARAVALGMLTVAAVLLTACGGSTAPTRPGAGSYPVPPGPVPFVPLPAQHQAIPATTVPESPAPAGADVPLCRAAQLRAQTRGFGGAAGTVYDNYRIRLVAGPACRLAGSPRLAALDGNRLVDLRFTVTRLILEAPWHGSVLVTRKHPAALRLAWPDGEDCWPATTVSGLRLALPKGRGTLSMPGLGTLRGTCEPHQSVVTPRVEVAPYAPWHYRSTRWISSWKDVRLISTWDRVRQAAPGSTLHLTATLEATHDTPLSPCPDVRIGVSGTGGSERRTYQLDCAGVTAPNALDAAGRPYLPAKVPVTFDVRLAVPATLAIGTDAKMWWYIPGPGLSLMDGGVLHVVAPASGTPSPGAGSP